LPPKGHARMPCNTRRIELSAVRCPTLHRTKTTGTKWRLRESLDERRGRQHGGGDDRVGKLDGYCALGRLTRNFAPFVDELLPRQACTIGNAPVDYGPGPGPRTTSDGSTAAPSLGLHPMSDLLSRFGCRHFSDRFRVLFFHADLQARRTEYFTSGQQATCSPYAFGLSVFPLPVSGSGYKAGDNLTMNPRTG